MAKHFVSVLMPCYREPMHYIQAAINSILQQTYKDIELILLLDDPDNQELKAMGLQYAKEDSRVRFFVNKKRSKLVATLNKGLQLATGDVIARLDADDIALPTRIEKQLRYAEDYDLISTNFAFINSQGNVIRHRVFPTEDSAIKKYLTKIADCMYHTTWLGKRSVFDALNGYREIGPFEDYDFLLRAVKKNMKLYNLSEELTYYRMNAKGISFNDRVRQHLGSEFIREHCENIEVITETDINAYLETEVGKKHAEEYMKFASVKDIINSANNTLEYKRNLLFYAPYISIFNYYGRKQIVNKLLGN